MSAVSGLRVGYVLKKYPRLSETFILNEILGLEAAGVEVSVLSLRLPDEGRFHAELADVRAEVAYLTGFGAASAMAAFRRVARHADPGALDRALELLDLLPPERQVGVLLQGLELAEVAAARGLDHLHAHFMTVAAHTAYVAHVFSGIPFSVTAHAKDVYRDEVDIAAFRTVAAAASAVVTVCDANRRFIEERLLAGVDATVVRIYNGLDLASMPVPGPRRPELVLGVGRLVEKKGFDVLIRACRLLADRGVPFECAVIGDGDQAGALADEIDGLGVADRVRLLGSLPKAEVLEWMARAAVLALPCVTGGDGNRDALPTVLLEALAVGLPVVSTPVAGVPEIVDDGVEGLLVPERDPVALAGAIELLLTDTTRWSAASTAGPAKVAARFDRRATLPALLDVFAGPGRAVEGVA